MLQSLANPLNKIIGVEGAAHVLFNLALTAILFLWIRRNGLSERYGLCGTSVPARKFLWYIPLLLLASNNLWNGIAVNMPAGETACYILYMLCVGFVEEVLFRGFLFKAIAKDGVKSAIILSSVTFGLGHMLNMVNGNGMGLVENLCQVAGAIAVGFLFVTIFYRSGSLIPCILTHSAINAVSAFANEAGLTEERWVARIASWIAIAVIYTLLLTRTLPEGGKNRE